jgi:hypothetical protein
MKKITFFMAIFLIPLISFSQINYQLDIDISDIKTTTKDNFDLIEITGYENSAITAAPLLPVKKLNFIIPAGQNVSDIKINIIEEEILQGTFRIYPVQPEHITSYEWLNLPKREFAEPDSCIYKKNKIYPSYVFENTGFQYVSGATIASIIFNPIRYNPVTGIVKYIRAVDISLVFEDSNDLSVKPVRLSERSYHILKNRLKSLVENPSDVDLYFQVNNIEGSQNKTESFNSSEIPSLVGSNIDYVIITNETLKTKFEQISGWKTKKGLPSVVRTVEWIDDNYAGSDGKKSEILLSTPILNGEQFGFCLEETPI